MTGVRIQLAHVLAPPADEVCAAENSVWNCGEDATASLAKLIAGETLVCTSIGVHPAGGYWATCKADGMDIGYALLAEGSVLARPGAPQHYVIAGDLARNDTKGLWAASSLPSDDWAKVEVAAPKNEARNSSSEARSERSYRNGFGCAIKGNRSRRGEWIYHLPGQEYYDATRPEELFCTEREAVAAGYRRAKA